MQTDGLRAGGGGNMTKSQQQFKAILDAYDRGYASKTDVALALTEMCGTAGKKLTDRACKILSRSR